MTDDTLKVDRPVHGEIHTSYRTSVPQYSAQEFMAEVDAALDTPGVTALVWEQYTPYFNDGDPCEFSVGEVRVVVDGDEGAAAAAGEYRDYEHGLTNWDLYEHNDKYPFRDGLDVIDWRTFGNGVSGRVIYELLNSLHTGAWENVARANFGDHAVVTATKSGFEVEFYEHY